MPAMRRSSCMPPIDACARCGDMPGAAPICPGDRPAGRVGGHLEGGSGRHILERLAGSTARRGAVLAMGSINRRTRPCLPPGLAARNRRQFLVDVALGPLQQPRDFQGRFVHLDIARQSSDIMGMPGPRLARRHRSDHHTERQVRQETFGFEVIEFPGFVPPIAFG